MDEPRMLRWPNWVEWIVLVVCAVILVGLLLPAVGIRNYGARRNHCSNNLKNLALATVNFESSKGRFPGYQEMFGIQNDGVGKIGSWVVAVLPYVEQQALRDLWDDQSANLAWEQSQDIAAPSFADFYPEIAILTCPADPQLSEHAPLSYAANTGFYLAADDPALEFDAYLNADTASLRSTISQRVANGIFSNQLPPAIVQPSGLRLEVFGACMEQAALSDVRDGLSQTILLSENLQATSWSETSVQDDSPRWKLGIVWHYVGDQTDGGRPQPRPIADEMRLNGAKLETSTSPTTARPSSNHPGVVNVAMADGSIVSLDEGTDYHVYQALMTPNSLQSDVPRASYRLKVDDFRW